MVSLTVAVTLGRRRDWNTAAFAALVAAFPDTGYMGVPLLVALLGTQAAAPAIVTILLDLLFTSSLSSRCRDSARRYPRRRRGGAQCAQGRRGQPDTMGNHRGYRDLCGGVAGSRCSETIGLLADAASPAALFTIGAVLARSQWPPPRARRSPTMFRWR